MQDVCGGSKGLTSTPIALDLNQIADEENRLGIKYVLKYSWNFVFYC